MSQAYDELLLATIEHLRELKARGQKYVQVSPEALNALLSRSVPAASARKSGSNSSPPASLAALRRSLEQPSSAPDKRPSPAQTAAPPRASTSGLNSQSEQPAPAPKNDATLVQSGQLLEGDARVNAMAELRARALVCQKCAHLASSRRNVVFGVGNIFAELMFVGEAPGMDEDAQAEPFVGRAGQLLTKIIETMGLSREKVYIANVLKCRPDTPGQAFGNRKPTPAEMSACLPYLQAQIDLIRPRIIVALGGTAVEGLFGRQEVRITAIRGKWDTFRGIPVMPTYHPSYLLRPNPRNIKREVWEDMLQVMEKLGLPISEKQRGYFL